MMGRLALYNRLADGHATKFIQERAELGEILSWNGSSRHKAAMTAFQVSALSKKPGRVIERMVPHVRPAFNTLRVMQWDKKFKAVFAVRMASARETDVFYMTPHEREAFSERSAFLADLLFYAHGDQCNASLNVASNVSHHAISRLLERKGSTPESLRNDIVEILQQARALRQFLSVGIDHSMTKMRDGMTYDLFVPFRTGGLVIRTLRVNAVSKTLLSDPIPVFSIRTFLDESMLSARHRERMAGFRLSRDALVSEEDSRHTLRWIEGNAEETDPGRRLEVS